MKHLTQEYIRERLSYDPETGDWVWKKNVRGQNLKGKLAGSRKPDGYLLIEIDGKKYRSARLAFLYMTGNFPKNEVDHIDQNRRNDSWNNLREATRSEQQLNRKKVKRKQDDHLPKGVYQRKNRFIAIIGINRKNIYLGSFKEVEEAKKAFEEAYRFYRG